MTEQTYTLEEAERVIAARECAATSHSLDQTCTTHGDLIRIHCTNCGQSWATTPISS